MGRFGTTSKSGSRLEVAEINQIVEISINLVLGLIGPITLKLQGTIGEQEVTAFIDLGARHNFMSQGVV